MVRVREHEDLADVIADRLNKVTGVTGTNTHIAFRTYSSHDLEAAFSLGLEATERPDRSAPHRRPEVGAAEASASRERVTSTQRRAGRAPPPESIAASARSMPARTAVVSAARDGVGLVEAGRGRQRDAGVEHHGVAHRAALAGEQVAGDLGVVLGVAAAQRLDRAALEADVGGVERSAR